jgi:hypothetical protein
VNTLAIDPQNPTTIYASGGGDDGMFKSTDGGATWTEVNYNHAAFWASQIAPVLAVLLLLCAADLSQTGLIHLPLHPPVCRE